MSGAPRPLGLNEVDLRELMHAEEILMAEPFLKDYGEGEEGNPESEDLAAAYRSRKAPTSPKSWSTRRRQPGEAWCLKAHTLARPGDTSCLEAQPFARSAAPVFHLHEPAGGTNDVFAPLQDLPGSPDGADLPLHEPGEVSKATRSRRTTTPKEPAKSFAQQAATAGPPKAAPHLLKALATLSPKMATPPKTAAPTAGRQSLPIQRSAAQPAAIRKAPPSRQAAVPRHLAATPIAGQTGTVVQPMFLLNWLLPRKQEVTAQDFQYQAGAAAAPVTHAMTVTNSPKKKGRERSIDMQIGDGAHLTGDIDPGGQAFINHVASGRFGGRRVGYLLILRFARLAKKEGATRIRLGNAVNWASYRASGDNDPSIEAALHVYETLGFDVSTRAAAEATSRTPQQLIDTATPLVGGRWINPAAAAEAAAEAEAAADAEAEENSVALGSLIEQLLMGR